MVRRAALALTVMTLAISLPGTCQDLVKVASTAAKVEYEDANIRVVRLKLAPHETLPMHDRPARVVIPLTANDVVTTRSDGTTSKVQSPAGKAVWSEPGKRSVTNLESPLENIVVELKNAREPAKALTASPTPRPKEYLEDRFHHWAFENQYVRVYDVRIPPGETTDFHLHALDTVFVQISGGIESAQVEGQEWKADPSKPGEVSFSGDRKKPRTHRVRNDSTKEYHVIAVQLVP